ncbi:MAG TPA: DUF2244 domain-containing protein [Caulobacteraceae bacterium]|jgi:uncharacterized membrane protein
MDAAPASPLFLDTVITPHRSLPKRGLFLLIGLLVAVNLALAIVFVSMGAPPVPVFLGLDVLGVCLAFWVSYRQARRVERVQVGVEQVRVLREHGRSRRLLWATPTAFTRVHLDCPGEHEARVRLALSGREMTVGAQLSIPERRSLFNAINDAIKEARGFRYPSA